MAPARVEVAAVAQLREEEVEAAAVKSAVASVGAVVEVGVEVEAGAAPPTEAQALTSHP